MSQRESDRFIRERRSGKVGPTDRCLTARIELDLKFLLAVLNWAAKSGDERTACSSSLMPGLRLLILKEKNLTRVLLTTSLASQTESHHITVL